jgi:uncharacterized membrane protein
MVDAARGAGKAGAWGEEVDDLLRGLSGGVLVGIPLIYTMEMWWIGETISMPRAIGFVVIAYRVPGESGVRNGDGISRHGAGIAPPGD